MIGKRIARQSIVPRTSRLYLQSPPSSLPPSSSSVVTVNLEGVPKIQLGKPNSANRKMQIGLSVGLLCLVLLTVLSIGLPLELRTGESSTVTTSTSSSTSTVGVQYGGVNLAGMDFGCVTNGSCASGFTPPPSSQAAHFTALGMNIFRVPIGWQYLQPLGPGSAISASIFHQYDTVVQNIFTVNPSAKVIVEIHNYARYNGLIVGQDSGAPTNVQFVNLWSQIAAYYQNNANIIFGIMNEPHNLNMSQWVVTLQAVVNAIRATGATTQLITLPGTNYQSVGGFSAVSGIYLSSISDPVGGTSLLLYDVHQYLDIDYSGTHTTCVTDAVNNTFVPFATYLRANGRMAMLSETGGGSTPSCESYVGSELAYLNANSDVFYGFVEWAAGSFSTSYALSMVPFANGSDQGITAVFVAAIKKSSKNNSSSSSTTWYMARKDTIKIFFLQETLIIFLMKTLWSRISC